MSNTIQRRIEGSVAILTLNRPDRYNSVTRELAFALQEELDFCASDDAVRCVVLTGAGKGFCAGQDLSEASDVENLDFEKLVEEHYNAIIRRMRQMEKPIIAAVNGVAAGAGANIALAADIVLATESASFVQAFSKISLIPDSGGTFFLPRLVGLQRALALAMTADKVMATEAQAMGMVYKVFPDADFEKSWMEMAQRLGAMPTKALGLTKRLMNESFSNGLNAQLEQEMIVQAEAGRSADFAEGVNAFLQKRAPQFTGQ
jgi:2-(1,2-epoxy-1,2-dihydrophenyl)acetyl-CoA isomerase